jgi:uncharacterized protein (TIGR00369 family)
MRLTRCDAAGVTIDMPARAELVGSPSTRALHGGLYAVMIDVATSYAVMAQTGRSIATVDLRVDFHRPGMAERYVITGSDVRIGRTLGTADAWVHDAAGTLLASGRGVVMHIDR